MLLNMSLSPNSSLLQRAIDLNYANKKRSTSIKWIIANGILFMIFVYDLCVRCGGVGGAASWWGAVEAAAALLLAAALLQHARHLLPPAAPPAARITRAQRRLLGLSHARLDSSFREAENEVADEAGAWSRDEPLSLSLGSARAWRSDPPSPHTPPSPSTPHSPHSPHSPNSPHSPHSPHSPSSPYSPQSQPRYERDEFIADREALANYLQRREQRECEAEVSAVAGACAVAGAGWPSHTYQLAALDPERSEEGGGVGGGAAGGGSPQLWRTLQIDPRSLTQFNLNLRLWLHVTVLSRLSRHMDAVDAALPPDHRLGQVSTERLRKLAGLCPALASLLPFLEPFGDQAYVVQRYRELARGGCLSGYKWNGGNAQWDEAKPTDAELVMHAFTAYMDAQLGGAFSGAHVSCGGPTGPTGPGGLALHRARWRPPHWLLLRGEQALEVGAGRCNVPHALLLLLAAAAQQRPPALARTHLGPAGLNMLWIIGR